jgi:hypothetical protein
MIGEKVTEKYCEGYMSALDGKLEENNPYKEETVAMWLENLSNSSPKVNKIFKRTCGNEAKMTLQEIYQLRVRWFRLPSWDVGTFWEINHKDIIIFNLWKPVAITQIFKRKRKNKIELSPFYAINHEKGGMDSIWVDDEIFDEFLSRSDWEEVKLLEE